MEPDVEKRFERIEALLHAMAGRENQMEIRFNQRMEQAAQRMDRAEQRMDRAEQRMEKFDRQLKATHKIVQVGMKLMVRLEERQKATDIKIEALTASVREIAKSQKALLDSLRRGGNGSRHAV